MILNGSVEVQVEGQEAVTLHLGESFGVKPTLETYYHKGVMTTRVDDCQVRRGSREQLWTLLDTCVYIEQCALCISGRKKFSYIFKLCSFIT